VVTAIDDETPETAETADDAEIEVPVEAVDGFEALYRTEYVPMLRVAYLLLHSTELAEEAVHDAFAKVYERWSPRSRQVDVRSPTTTGRGRTTPSSGGPSATSRSATRSCAWSGGMVTSPS
jgi:hypothetical protein